MRSVPATAAEGEPRAGTPAWWASRPAPAPAPARGRGRPPRSFASIVAAASQLLDEVGPGAFSMRVLAGRLGTSTATLYRHVTGVDELMVHVVDRVFGEIAAADTDEQWAGWQEAVRAAAVRFHRVLSAHPNLLPLLVAQVPVGPNGLAVRERTIATFVRFGFSAREAARAYTALAHYVIGFAMQQQAPGAPGRREAEALRDYYRSLDPDRYPNTVRAADALTGVGPEEEFLEGLQFILDGLRAGAA